MKHNRKKPAKSSINGLINMFMNHPPLFGNECFTSGTVNQFARLILSKNQDITTNI